MTLAIFQAATTSSRWRLEFYIFLMATRTVALWRLRKLIRGSLPRLLNYCWLKMRGSPFPSFWLKEQAETSDLFI